MVADKYKSLQEKGAVEMVRYAGQDIKEFLVDHERNSANTARSYKTDLKFFAKEMFNTTIEHLTYEQLEKLDYELFKKYRDNQYGKYANKTINRRRAAVISLYSDLVKRGKLNVNMEMLRGVKVFSDTSKETPYLSTNEGLAIAEYYNKPNSKSQLTRNMFYVMLETAKRATEVVNMKWEDLNDVNGKIIWRSKGKGRKEFREVIPNELYKMLLSTKIDPVHVFPFSESTARNRIEEAKKELGISEGTLHSFRRTALTYVYNKTGNARIVQVKGNHKSFDTTSRYIQDNDIEANGVFSGVYGVDKDLYKTADVSLLMEALGNMKGEFKMLLNAEINRLSKK